MSAEVGLLREAATHMPEPPDRGLVGLVDPSGETVMALFERDDSALAEAHEDSWYDSQGDAWTWPEVLAYAARTGREVHRLYLREDLPRSAVEALDAIERVSADA